MSSMGSELALHQLRSCAEGLQTLYSGNIQQIREQAKVAN
jgi:hypothetical protein